MSSSPRRASAPAAHEHGGPGAGGDGPAPGAARWPAVVGLALCALGLGVAGYLTFEHYTAAASLSCPFGGGAIDCYRVTTSVYSTIGGVPVAALGIAFFAVMAALQSPAAWRSARRDLRAARVAWAALGVGVSLWLISVELFRVDAICLWCTTVHVLAFLLFASTVIATAIEGAAA